MEIEKEINNIEEDLRKWFKDKWVNIGKKDKSGKHHLVVRVEKKEDMLNVFLHQKLVQ